MMYDGGDVPVCVECLDMRKPKRKPPVPEQHIQNYTALSRDFVEAMARYRDATEEFEAMMGKLRSGLLYPQRIKNASSDLTIARNKMMTAYSRLNEYFAGHLSVTSRMVS